MARKPGNVKPVQRQRLCPTCLAEDEREIAVPVKYYRAGGKSSIRYHCPKDHYNPKAACPFAN